MSSRHDAATLAIEDGLARTMMMLREFAHESDSSRDYLRGMINGLSLSLRVLDPDRYHPGIAFNDAWLDARGLKLPNDHEISDQTLLRAAQAYLNHDD